MVTYSIVAVFLAIAIIFASDGQCLRMKWKDLVFAAAPDIPSVITRGSLTKVTFCVPFEKKWYHSSSTTLSKDVYIQLVSGDTEKDGTFIKKDFATLPKGMRMEMKDELQNEIFKLQLHFPRSDSSVFFSRPHLKARFPKTNDNERAVCFEVRGEISNNFYASKYRFEVNAPGLSEALGSDWIPLRGNQYSSDENSVDNEDIGVDDDSVRARKNRVQEWIEKQVPTSSNIYWATLQSVGSPYHIAMKKYDRTIIHLQYSFFSAVPNHRFTVQIKALPSSTETTNCNFDIITSEKHEVRLSLPSDKIICFFNDEALAIDPVLRERALPNLKQIGNGKLYYFDIYISGVENIDKANEKSHMVTITSSKESGKYATKLQLKKFVQEGAREHIELKASNEENHYSKFTCVGKCSGVGKLTVESHLVFPVLANPAEFCKNPIYLNLEAYEQGADLPLDTYAVPFICRLIKEKLVLESAFPLDCLPKLQRNMNRNLVIKIASPYAFDHGNLKSTIIGVPKFQSFDHEIFLSENYSNRVVRPLPIMYHENKVTIKIGISDSTYKTDFENDRPRKIIFKFYKIDKNAHGLLEVNGNPISKTKSITIEERHWEHNRYRKTLDEAFFDDIEEIKGDVFVIEVLFANERLDGNNNENNILNGKFGEVYGKPFRSPPLLLLKNEKDVVYAEEMIGKDGHCHFPYSYAFLAVNTYKANKFGETIPRVRRGNVIIQIFDVDKGKFISGKQKIETKLVVVKGEDIKEIEKSAAWNYDYSTRTAWTVLPVSERMKNENGYFVIIDANKTEYQTKPFQTLE